LRGFSRLIIFSTNWSKACSDEIDAPKDRHHRARPGDLINRARRCAKRVLKCRALSIEMAGTGPAMTIPCERNAL
jgi:hypothetical protein